MTVASLEELIAQSLTKLIVDLPEPLVEQVARATRAELRSQVGHSALRASERFVYDIMEDILRSVVVPGCKRRFFISHVPEEDEKDFAFAESLAMSLYPLFEQYLMMMHRRENIQFSTGIRDDSDMEIDEFKSSSETDSDDSNSETDYP